MALYKIYNGPMPTTAALPKVATGATIKTMLQVQAGTVLGLKIIEWGVSFDAAADAAKVQCELIETNVAATVTAHVTSGVHRFDDQAALAPDPVGSLILVGTGATGYTATVEGAITAARLLDAQLVSPAAGQILQWPLAREAYMQPGSFWTRIRVTAPATVNMYCYVIVST